VTEDPCLWHVRKGQRAQSGVLVSATDLLLIVVFSLTQQSPCRRIRPTFPGGFSSQRKVRKSSGGACAISSRLDSAVHQRGMYGARNVVARGSSALRALYELRRAIAARSATPGPSAAASSPHAKFVPSVPSEIDGARSRISLHSILQPALK